MAKALLAFGVLLGLPLSIEALGRIYEGTRLSAPWPSERLSPKQPGDIRVFVYGESIVNGAPEKSVGFVAQLQFVLERTYPKRKISVVPFAASGGPSSETAVRFSRTVDQQPDVIVIMTGGNDVSGTAPPSWLQMLSRKSAAVREIPGWAAAIARRIAPERFVETPWPDKLVRYDRADMPDRVAGLQSALELMVGRARELGVPVLLCTEPPNIRDWAPVHIPGTADYERSIAAIDTAISRGDTATAANEIARAEPAFADDAMLLYFKGKLDFARRNYSSANALFLRAKETDPYAWRMPAAFNKAIREIARQPGVRLVDVDQLFNERAEGGSPGFDLLADNGHPTPAGGSIIAGALVKEVRRLVPGSSGADCCDVETFLAARHFKGSPAELAYHLQLGKYSMKTPWYFYTIARDHLDSALAIDSTNWEIWANLATLSMFKGQFDRGRQELDRAKAFKRSPIDPEDREATPYLKEALRSARAR